MIRQQLGQHQSLKILPQQIQLLNLFFLNSIELEQRIKNELETNLFLETAEPKETDEDAHTENERDEDYREWEEMNNDDITDHKADVSNYLSADSAPQQPIADITTYKEDAHCQLQLLTLPENIRLVADYIIDALNSSGFLDRPLDELADDMSFYFQHIIEPETINTALAIVKSLEPFGIGCSNIQEFLLLQLKTKKMTRQVGHYAMQLIQNHYEDLMHKKFEKIQQALKIDDIQLSTILALIGGLKFHPVNEVSVFNPHNTIIPDYNISNHNGKLQISLCSGRSDTVTVNHSLHNELIAQVNQKEKSAIQYVRGKFADAQWFVNAIKQRENTMLHIMKCIVEMQHDYFIEGDIRQLKPMVLRHVAEKSGMDIATISRITCNKYAQTHFGMLYLKKLFSEGIADNNGKVISNKVIQSFLEETIASEDKKQPYTDQQLVKLLADSGYNVARRTVAKYRDQLTIPIAQIRAVRG